MSRLLTLCLAGVFAASVVAWAADKPRSDKAILEDLKNTVQALLKDRNALYDEKKIEEHIKKLEEQTRKHVATAQELLKEIERDHPKSPLLAEARSSALFVLHASPEQAVIDKTLVLARKLKEGAARGSDFAAQADLILLHAEISKLLKEAENDDQLKKVWTRNGDRLHKLIEEYLKTYPKYPPALVPLRELTSLARTAAATRTWQMVEAFVLKNFPDDLWAKEIRRELAVGKVLEFDFTAVGAAKPSGLKSLRGKVVVIDFWATWCDPCVKEMPGLKKLYEKHAKDGLEIIGVSLDDDAKALTEFLKEKKVPWPQVFGKTATDFADKWAIEAIPAMFVVDRKGKLRSIEGRGKLEKLVPDLLAEK